MNCQNVQKSLSLFIDDMLDPEVAIGVSEHLQQCTDCGRELRRLAVLKARLGFLGHVSVPDYLRHMLQMRLANAKQDTWRIWLRDALDYRWSRIRTTEGLWYLTRILGTASTFVFFFALCAAMSPMVFGPQVSERVAVSESFRQELASSVLKNLGLLPVEAQRRPISSSDPMINAEYLLNFGQSASRKGADDTFSVVAVVDQSGSAKIQSVLEYPADTTLLYNFNSMITSARYRPASHNGRAVDSHLVHTFSRISVYD